MFHPLFSHQFAVIKTVSAVSVPSFFPTSRGKAAKGGLYASSLMAWMMNRGEAGLAGGNHTEGRGTRNQPGGKSGVE